MGGEGATSYQRCPCGADCCCAVAADEPCYGQVKAIDQAFIALGCGLHACEGHIDWFLGETDAHYRPATGRN